MWSSASQTGSSVFGILESPGDRLAWEKFVDRYAPKILNWCRSRGLQDADAEDITQEVLVKFSKNVRGFVYDSEKSGFRAWLRTVTKNTLCDVLRAYRLVRASGDSVIHGVLEKMEAANDLDDQLDEEFRREVMERAMELVRSRVEPRTWQAFELLVSAGKSPKDVAVQLELNVSAVYMAKSRVKQMLELEVRRLEGTP